MNTVRKGLISEENNGIGEGSIGFDRENLYDKCLEKTKPGII